MNNIKESFKVGSLQAMVRGNGQMVMSMLANSSRDSKTDRGHSSVMGEPGSTLASGRMER